MSRADTRQEAFYTQTNAPREDVMRVTMKKKVRKGAFQEPLDELNPTDTQCHAG